MFCFVRYVRAARMWLFLQLSMCMLHNMLNVLHLILCACLEIYEFRVSFIAFLHVCLRFQKIFAPEGSPSCQRFLARMDGVSRCCAGLSYIYLTKGLFFRFNHSSVAHTLHHRPHSINDFQCCRYAYFGAFEPRFGAHPRACCL